MSLLYKTNGYNFSPSWCRDIDLLPLYLGGARADTDEVNIYDCPLDSPDYGGYYGYTSYGLNYGSVGDKYTSHRRPSTTSIFSSSAGRVDGVGVATYYLYRSWDGTGDGVISLEVLAKKRHQGGLNVIFMDWHLEFYIDVVPDSGDFWASD